MKTVFIFLSLLMLICIKSHACFRSVDLGRKTFPYCYGAFSKYHRKLIEMRLDYNISGENLRCENSDSDPLLKIKWKLYEQNPSFNLSSLKIREVSTDPLKSNSWDSYEIEPRDLIDNQEFRGDPSYVSASGGTSVENGVVFKEYDLNQDRKQPAWGNKESWASIHFFARLSSNSLDEKEKIFIKWRHRPRENTANGDQSPGHHRFPYELEASGNCANSIYAIDVF
jgi:hypothetical protein